MASRGNRHAQYQRRKERCLLNNLCFKCGLSKEGSHSKTLCPKCLEKNRTRENQQRAGFISQGLCGCGQQPVPGNKSCQKCLDVGKEVQAGRRSRHRAQGVCLTCGALAEPGKTACRECSARATTSTMKRYHQNKAGGVCAHCGGDLTDHKFRCNSCQEKHLERGKIVWLEKRLVVITRYGGKCFCCGETMYEFMEIDHIDNDGNKHREEVGSHIIEWVINNNFPNNMQLACANCNRGRAKFGICPHQQQPSTEISKRAKRLRNRRLKVITHYGGFCVCCGESNWAFLEFDHANNDRHLHRKQFSRNITADWLIKHNYPTDIQLLCSNCNKAKGLYGRCPHPGPALRPEQPPALEVPVQAGEPHQDLPLQVDHGTQVTAALPQVLGTEVDLNSAALPVEEVQDDPHLGGVAVVVEDLS